MRTPYHESVGGMWSSHAAAPLRASDIALYHYVARKTHANGWRMPVYVANGLMCPMLFEKSTLETARKLKRTEAGKVSVLNGYSGEMLSD